MSKIFGENVYAGLSGLELEEQSFELGEGIMLHRTYAHLMAPFMMAFNPAPPGGHHPAPWKAASGGFAFDVNVELLIPEHIEEKFGSKIAVAKTILFLIRLGITPAATLSVFSNQSFSLLPTVGDRETTIVPSEVMPRHFPLSVENNTLTTESASWLTERWQTTHQLLTTNKEFSLAVEAIDSGQFVQSSALAMVSLMGALEALFSSSTSELRFRVSALTAAYLEPPGKSRHELQKKISKLYDKRSAAAHGTPKHDNEDLLQTFSLLRRVLLRFIDSGNVPKKNELEELLFGTTSSPEA